MFEKLNTPVFKNEKNPPQEKLILIVEDNDVDHKIIERVVQKLGHRSLSAHNGQEGLDIVKTQKPDLIILDCEMPVMTGHQMCESLKSEEVTKDIPILFLTSIDTPSNVIECFELQADNFLRKPIPTDALISHIKSILQESATSK